MFGRKIPEGVDGATWGARAIYDSRCTIDLVPDRQQCSDGTEAERETLVAWINRVGLPEMRKRVKAAHLETNSREVFSFDRDGYHIEACPQGSYGYLYLGAWKVSA